MSDRERLHMLLDEMPDDDLPKVLVFFQNLHNDYDDYVERALDEADFEAEHTTQRLTHEEVFDRIRRKINAAVQA